MWLIFISRAKTMTFRRLRIYQLRMFAPDGQARQTTGGEIVI
jgi:hypothetical protein